MLPTLQDALQHMGFDYEDPMVSLNAQRALNTAIATMHGAVGKDAEKYLPDDPRITELVLIYTDDLYSERGASTKVSYATRRLVSDMELQLRMELRRAKEAADS